MRRKTFARALLARHTALAVVITLATSGVALRFPILTVGTGLTHDERRLRGALATLTTSGHYRKCSAVVAGCWYRHREVERNLG